MKIPLILAAPLLAWAMPATAAQPFDGTWQVTVLTRTGSCAKAARFPVSVSEGRMRYVGPQAYRVDGRISRSGILTGTVSTGSARAAVSGRLGAAEGGGAWTSSGMAACAGRWNALRED